MTIIVDFETIKQQQRIGWQTGNYARVGNTLQIMAELLVEAAQVHAGEAVLDVACGQGNGAIAAALRFADATGLDYAANLLDQARQRASTQHLDIEFVEGDAEQLPFPADSFDVALSIVGIMFAPHQQRAADELVRVVKPGGRIALASWTPDGMAGHLFKIVGAYAPPAAGLSPASLWGTTDHLSTLFGPRVTWTATNVRQYVFHFKTPQHYAEYLCEFYGPTARLSAGLDEARRAQFKQDLADLISRFNRATDGTVAAPADYLEAVGTRNG